MADDKTNPDAPGQVDGEGTQDDATTGDKGGGDSDSDDDSRIIFDSQDDLDALVEKRLRRDRRDRRKKGAVDKAGDKAESGQQQDDDEAQRKADARVEKAQRLAARAEALVAATEAGLTGDRAKAAVKLADLDLTDVVDDDGEVDGKAVTAAVKAAIKAYPFLKVEADAPATEGDTGNTRKPPVGGNTQKPDGDKGTDAMTPERFAELSYTERVQLFNRDPQLYERLAG